MLHRRSVSILLAALLILAVSGPIAAHAQRDAPFETTESDSGFGSWLTGTFWTWLSALFAPEHGQIVPALPPLPPTP